MKIISVRECPQYKERAIKYFSSKWSVPEKVYEDSITHCITASNPLPQWYLLEKDEQIIGSAGLITNDFISRMDLYPWVCGVFIEEEHRGNAYASVLLERARRDARKAGFEHMYLCTDHIGFYEKYGYHYIGQGYHPWGEESRIYEISTAQDTSFRIRTENEKDYDKIYDLIKTAFRTANVKGGDEQDFAVNLRKSANYIPELALVAEQNDQLIGHIMLTKTKVTQPDGSEFEGLLLAPVSVQLEYRDYGIGKALINESCRLAEEMGYKAVFLVGDPAYYSRLGFVPTSRYDIMPKDDIPPQYVQVRELVTDALKDVHGRVECC